MSESTNRLRDQYKTQIANWEKVFNPNKSDKKLLEEIQIWGQQLENDIQEKIKFLAIDLSQYNIQGEYQRSISEGFDDLERIMRTHKTVADIVTESDPKDTLHKIKQHYSLYLVPLLNIIGKLENDTMASVTQNILENRKKLMDGSRRINTLLQEKLLIKQRLFALNRKQEYLEVLKEIKRLEFQEVMLRLTIRHDQLNLYYFNHDRPKDLNEIKEKADKYHERLQGLEEERREILKIHKVHENLELYEDCLDEYTKIKEQHQKHSSQKIAPIWPKFEHEKGANLIAPVLPPSKMSPPV